MLIEKPSANEETGYKRQNEEQILKIRRLFRESGYLSLPMEQQTHLDIEKKVLLSDDLLNFGKIGSENLKKYIKGKCEGTQVKLVQIYETEKEKLESEKVENKTIEEIKILIFEIIAEMAAEKQSLHEEIFIKNVKNKTKEKYVEYFYQLRELDNGNQHEESK